jgi:hypothetical protein
MPYSPLVMTLIVNNRAGRKFESLLVRRGKNLFPLLGTAGDLQCLGLKG